MNRHPYIGAYMAGVLVPNLFLLIGIIVVLLFHSVYALPASFWQFIIFPMAVVPNLWGAWNTLYVATVLKRWIPLGAWGGFLPLIIFASGLGLERALDLSMFAIKDMLIVLPVALPAYYLIWKHIVRFLNRVVGVE
jgi:hypothetical protein